MPGPEHCPSITDELLEQAGEVGLEGRSSTEATIVEIPPSDPPVPPRPPEPIIPEPTPADPPQPPVPEPEPVGEVHDPAGPQPDEPLEAVDVVHEDAAVIAYHHTRPFFADAHIVVVPKQHVASLLDPAADDLLPQLLTVVRQVAAEVLEAHGAARVLTNSGRYQESKHLHWHVYAGTETAGTNRGR